MKATVTHGVQLFLKIRDLRARADRLEKQLGDYVVRLPQEDFAEYIKATGQEKLQ